MNLYFVKCEADEDASFVFANNCTDAIERYARHVNETEGAVPEVAGVQLVAEANEIMLPPNLTPDEQYTGLVGFTRRHAEAVREQLQRLGFDTEQDRDLYLAISRALSYLERRGYRAASDHDDQEAQEDAPDQDDA